MALRGIVVSFRVPLRDEHVAQLTERSLEDLKLGLYCADVYDGTGHLRQVIGEVEGESLYLENGRVCGTAQIEATDELVRIFQVGGVELGLHLNYTAGVDGEIDMINGATLALVKV